MTVITRRAYLATLSAAATPAAAQMLLMGETSEGFVLLFNGRDIDSWDGDSAPWKIDRGILVADTSGLSAPAVLTYLPARYRDLELRLDIRVSAAMRHCVLRLPGHRLKLPPSTAPGYKPAEWNEYAIAVKAGKITVKLNGGIAAEIAFTPPRESESIALEAPPAAGGKAEFRNIRARTL